VSRYERRINMKAHSFKSLSILFGITLLAIFLGSYGLGNAQETIKLGLIGPYTGDGALYGDPVRDGYQLAVKEINDEGGIKGKKIQGIYEDDQGTPRVGISIVRKLIDVDKVVAIGGPIYTSVSLALGPVVSEKKIVMLNSLSEGPTITLFEGGYVFRMYPSNTISGLDISNVAADKLHAKKAAIIAIHNDYGLDISEVFKNNFGKKGGTVVIQETYKEGTKDFRTSLMKIHSLKPDVIFMPGYVRELPEILVQARELGMKEQFLGPVSFYDKNMLKLAGEAAEGVIFPTPWWDIKSQDPVTVKFVKGYRAMFNKDPENWAPYGYDTVKVLAEAINRGGTSSEGIKKALHELKDYPCVTGKVTYDKDNQVLKPMKILQVKKGEFVDFD
jgi:branched-chain amino acid transport system substrate-binding protein